MLSANLRFTRVAIGLLWQETNAFNPAVTGADEFVRHAGDALTAAYEDSETALGGIIRRLREAGIVPVATFAARARPGGPIEDAVVEELVDGLVESIREACADAICLELHGSMAGVGIDDVEGVLLERLRKAVGPDVPIVAALDLHGHVTEKMVRAADMLTGYRTHPHSDMAETGARAVDLLLGPGADGRHLAAVRRSVPMLALWRDETGEPAMRAVLDVLAREWNARPGIIDASIFNTHPFLDLPGMGQVVLTYGADDVEAAELADAVAAALWQQRDAFTGEAPDLTAVFALVGAGRPVAIGDQGDSVLAGAPGDSVEIARFAVTHAPQARGLVPVFDPDSAAKCIAAGVGSRLSLEIGAGVTPGLSTLAIDGTVIAITDGRFLNEGSYMKGVVNDLGATAVVRVGKTLFLLTSKPPAACDPALARYAGASLEELDYLVVKSSNHFRLSLSADCECQVAATPGLTSRRPTYLRHTRSRPLYPIDRHIPYPAPQERSSR